MDFDQFDQSLDSEVGERHHDIFTKPTDPDHAIEAGDKTATEAAFARAAQVVEIEAINNRVIVNFMEPRSCIASYDPGTQRLLVQIGTQGVHQQATRIAHALNLPLERVRVTTGDVGGGFGARSTTYPEYIACAYAAYKLGLAVRWCATRSECFISDTQARDHVTKAAMAFDRNGKILALRLHGRCNMGAHVVPRQPNSTVGNVIRMLVGAYAIPQAYLDFRGYVSNTIPINVYRGVGRFEDIYVVERLMDLAALRFGLDRAEIRRRNLVKPSAMPFTTPTGGIYDCGDFPRLMESALHYADWAGFQARKAEAAKRGRLRGIGVVYTIEGCGRHGTGVRHRRGEPRRDDRGRDQLAVAGARSRNHVRATRRRDAGRAIRQDPHYRRRH